MVLVYNFLMHVNYVNIPGTDVCCQVILQSVNVIWNQSKIYSTNTVPMSLHSGVEKQLTVHTLPC